MKRYGLIGVIAALVALVDQVTKQMACEVLPFGQFRPVIDGFFNLVHVRNRGAAFGFLNNHDTDWQFWFFAAATVLAVVVLLYLAKTAPAKSRLLFTAIGLVLGGAVGNFIDRCRFRYVIDFLDFYIGNWHWPAFNVADIGITCGVILLMYLILFGGKKVEQQPTG
ncbi:MAG: signal peptidase II [Deltaproteobacteria bacterium]|jgi:signal peptidase II|nr:signal peptidase II [Deltaproteobacteria bacterium]